MLGRSGLGDHVMYHTYVYASSHLNVQHYWETRISTSMYRIYNLICCSSFKAAVCVFNTESFFHPLAGWRRGHCVQFFKAMKKRQNVGLVVFQPSRCSGNQFAYPCKYICEIKNRQSRPKPPNW